MKKRKFKMFNLGFIMGLLLLTAGAFSGCGNVTLELASDISQKLIATEAYFVANVYTQEVEKDFDSDTSDNYVTNENYYVLISSTVTDEVPQIKLGKVTYEKGQNITTKVSAPNEITRKAFIQEDQKLYISSLLMFLNTGNDGDLIIVFPKNNYRNVVIEVYDDNNQLNISPKSMMAETLETVDESNFVYNFSIDNPNGQMFVEMKEGDQPLLATAVVIIEVVANPSMLNQSLSHKLATPETVTDIEGTGVVITPGYNGGATYEKGSPANHGLIYNFYVPQVGTKTLTINFFNIMA
jgi:hypothetical protein